MTQYRLRLIDGTTFWLSREDLSDWLNHWFEDETLPDTFTIHRVTGVGE